MADKESRETQQIHYIKGPYFETRRAEGVLAEETAVGAISLTFYVGRSPYPQMIEFEVLEDGELGKIVRAEGKKGIICELQQAVLLDAGEARDLRDQLTKLLDGERS